MEDKLHVFVSSVIDGMEDERKATQSSIRRIRLARPWLFESSPASSLPLDESYLSKVRACDIFVLLLKDRVTDPVRAEVSTAQAAEKPMLVFLRKDAPPGVVKYAQSLGVKHAPTFDNTDGLSRAVAEAVADELIRGYQEHRVPLDELGAVTTFLKSIRGGNIQTVVGQVSGSGSVAQNGGIAAGAGGVAARDIHGDVIIGSTVNIGEAPVKMTAVDHDSVRGRYLQHIISRNRYLQLQGIRSGGRLVNIELDRIYIRLRTTRQRTAELHERWLAEDACLAPGERRRLPDKASGITETVTVSVEKALASQRRLVVLGDPGSGKTTLLQYLALVYGRGMAENGNVVHDTLGLAEWGYLPILLPLRQVGSFLRQQHGATDGTEGHGLLLKFLVCMLENERIALTDGFFDSWLNSGTAVVLLDGLDEVADPDLRRRVSRLVECFTRAYPQCRYVVTSRIVGYTGAARLGENYKTTTVRDFTMGDVEQFLAAWHRQVAVGQMGPNAGADVYAAEQTKLLLAAIQSSEQIRELAINPLILTVIALLHRDRVKLPNRRAELYAELADVFLGKWDEAKGVNDMKVLADQPLDCSHKRQMLQDVALYMHEHESKELDTDDLRHLLNDSFGERVNDEWEAQQAAERFLAVVDERSGLLSARGEGTYAFSHVNFQEYLAALAVSGRDDYVQYTLRRVPDDWWREVIRLEAGIQSKERATKLIRAIADLRREREPYHNLILAIDCLRDVGVGRVQGDTEKTVLSRLRKELARPAPLVARWFDRRSIDWHERRAAAMEALGGVAAGYWREPFGEPEWIVVPSGEFWMGEGKEAHRVFLDEYSIARVPVTNAQYGLFMQNTSHRAPDHLEDGRPPRGLESHPVVHVTWFDALEYCRWLSRVTGKHMTLPSEAEWEKAARGTDGRVFPWGSAADPQKANYAATGIAATTAVGAFPGGASPYGCLDMSGNVWEWTRSLYGKYPYPQEEAERRKRENIEAPKTEYRVLRGGSFRYLEDHVRGACRDRLEPDGRDHDIGFRVAVSPFSSGL